MCPPGNPISYADAGVNIDAGDALVDDIKAAAGATSRSGVMGQLGGFGALFDLKQTGFQDPVLVAGTDGVGTKLLGGIESGIVEGLGQDLVAMCVNDLVCQGAEPLFFLDYFATGKLEPEFAARVIGGIAKACELAGCALIGGETAEMPQMYKPKHFDLAGFAVGAVEREGILPKTAAMSAGQRLVAWPSSGVHSNGFSLVRRILDIKELSWQDQAPWASADTTVADDLMQPTRLYIQEALAVLGDVHGLSHITGGGLPGNVGRMLPDHLAARLDPATWVEPAFFAWVIEQGLVERAEAYRAFNMGLGLVAVLRDGAAVPEGAILVGELVERQGGEPCQIDG